MFTVGHVCLTLPAKYKTVYVNDACFNVQTYNTVVSDTITEWAKKLLQKGKWLLNHVELDRQGNGNDCGVYVCFWMQ